MAQWVACMGRHKLRFAFMFRRFKKEREREQQHGGMLHRVYEQGFDACLAGMPRTPPAGYEGLIGLDLVGTWTAGWDVGHRELATPASSRSAA